MNMPDINKKMITVYLPLSTVAKLRKMAASRGTSMTDIIATALSLELVSVQLDGDDYRWIAQEVDKNSVARKRKVV